jgi:hypothetical protein
VVVRRVCERGLREVGLSLRNKVIGRRGEAELVVFFGLAALVVLVDWGVVLLLPVPGVALFQRELLLLVF